MMTSTLPPPVAPVWARLPLDAEGDYSSGLDNIAPGQMTAETRGDKLRDDLLPQALECRDALAGLMTTPASRRLLARADRFVREITNPTWAPDTLDSAMSKLADLLNNLRVLVAARDVRPVFTARADAVQQSGLARTEVAKQPRSATELSGRLARQKALSSSLSCSGPPSSDHSTAATLAKELITVPM